MPTKRKHGPGPRDTSGFSPTLTERYQSGKTISQIAAEISWSLSTVRLSLIREGCTIRSIKEAKGISSWIPGAHLRGRKIGPPSEETRRKLSEARRARPFKGTSAKVGGYVSFTTGPNKYRNVHTVIVEQQIGRRIRKGECVHHKDGNKHNNSPENLQLMTLRDHTSLHRKHAKS